MEFHLYRGVAHLVIDALRNSAETLEVLKVDASYPGTSFQIQSIKGIRMFKNLRELSLLSANVKNIASVKDLKKLRQLTIRNCQVSDLSPLLNKKQLSLSVQECPLTCPEVIAQLTTELRSVTICHLSTTHSHTPFAWSHLISLTGATIAIAVLVKQFSGR